MRLRGLLRGRSTVFRPLACTGIWLPSDPRFPAFSTRLVSNARFPSSHLATHLPCGEPHAGLGLGIFDESAKTGYASWAADQACVKADAHPERSNGIERVAISLAFDARLGARTSWATRARPLGRARRIRL